MIGEQFLWTEKYRPKTVKETILPVVLKNTFQGFVDQKNVPNLILAGKSGVGKTTIAKAMLDELGCDYIFVNASKERNIDMLRVQVEQFAASVSFAEGRKYVIFDEADWLNANSTQPALKAFMEEFANNCGFIFTCNYKNKIMDAIHSRCAVIDFVISKKEAAQLAGEFFNKVKKILETENVKYDPKTVATFIERYYPDWRRILNELQRYAKNGIIDTGILSGLSDESFKKAVGFLKEKNFTSIRTWVAENDVDSNSFFRKLFDTAQEYLTNEAVAQMILILGKYQYQAAFVADQQINLTACMIEIMMECKFK